MSKGQLGTILAIIFIILIAVILYFAFYPDPVVEDRYVCTQADKEAEACTAVYAPVCGWTFTNESIQTYGNRCVACIDEDVIFLTEGEC